jgi:hypothetical protein
MRLATCLIITKCIPEGEVDVSSCHVGQKSIIIRLIRLVPRPQSVLPIEKCTLPNYKIFTLQTESITPVLIIYWSKRYQKNNKSTKKLYSKTSFPN